MLKAVADPTRFKILKVLEKGELCVCELTEVLGLSQPTVSRHLRLLEDAGLVAGRREGQRMDFRLASPPPSSPQAKILALLASWAEEDPEIREARRKAEPWQESA